MKIFIAIFIGFLVVGQGASVPMYSISNATSIAMSMPEDLFTVIRNLIQGLISNLNTSSSTSGQTLTNMLAIIHEQRVGFLSELNSTLSEVTGNVEHAIQQVVNTGQIVSLTISECANQQTPMIDAMLANSMSNLTTCFSILLSDIQGSLSQVWNLVQSAAYMFVDIANQITTCGVAHFGDLLQTGDCVNQVLIMGQESANTIIIQLTTVSANAIALVTSAPTSLTVCGASRLSTSALEAARIFAEITQCSASAIASVGA